MTKKLFSVGLVLSAVLGASQAEAAKKTFVAQELSGEHEIPEVNSAASGTTAITVDDVTGAYCAQTKITPSTFAATLITLRLGDATTANGQVVADITGTKDSDGWLSGGTFDEDQLEQITTADTYVEVHTTPFPNGELRDQLVLDETANEIECPTVEQDAGADGGDAGDAGSDAGDAGTADAGDDDDDDIAAPPASDAAVTQKDASTTTGAPAAPGSTSSSCSTLGGGAPLGMGAMLVIGVAFAALLRRRRDAQ